MDYTRDTVCGHRVTPIEDIDWISLDDTNCEKLKRVKWHLKTTAEEIGPPMAVMGIIIGIVGVICEEPVFGLVSVFSVLALYICARGYPEALDNNAIENLKQKASQVESPKTNKEDFALRIKFRNKIGLYFNANTEIVLPCKYDFIEEEGNGFYFIVKDGKCGLYDINCKQIVLNCVYDKIIDFEIDSATVVQGGRTYKMALK